MALGNKEAAQIHNKTGSDLSAMQTKYDNNKHHEYIGFDEIDEECDGWMVSHREDRLIGCSIQRLTSTQYNMLCKLGV